MMKASVAALILVGIASNAAAQPIPFDMTPERPTLDDVVPPDAPLEVPDPAVPETAGRDGAPSAAPAGPLRRHLLPEGNLVLPGEAATRGWAVHLTAAQASSATRLHLGYRNAVVVAPENSRLQVLINNVVVIDEAVRNSEGFRPLDAALPEGLLRAGRNEISLRSRQRHRTDCSIASTYELWTEIDAEQTYLAIDDDAAANAFSGLADLRTLAPDAQGRTQIEIVAPALARSDLADDLLRLAQTLALYVSQPNLQFSISGAPDFQAAGPALRVFLGRASDLSDFLGEDIAEGGDPILLGGREGETPTLVIAGSDRQDWSDAVDQMLAPVDRPALARREAISTDAWRMPNAPMIFDRRSLTFGELGIPSEQFSGRRLARSFTFAIPADFYAGAYGQARLRLDAAYSDAVLPGGSINVYVNDNIAASMPLTSRGGAVLDQWPIDVTMRHFRPGLNEMTVEVDLLTDQDAACLPGAASDDTPRFAIFDTSRFVMPDYGRIAQYPNLAATAGTGYPYLLAEEPVAVVLEQDNAASLTAAANILGRIALAAGRSVPVSTRLSADSARTQDAIFIGPVNSIPPGVLGQVGVAEESRTNWLPATGITASGAADPASLAAWRQQVEGRGLRDVEAWFSETFDLTLDMMRFAPADAGAFMPSMDDALIIAQGVNPNADGLWTVVAAPDDAALTDGARAIAAQPLWETIAGQVTTLHTDMQTMVSRPASRASFAGPIQPSLANYRLIAANWLSANILSYALLLVLGCGLLGLSTSALLSRLGRRR